MRVRRIAILIDGAKHTGTHQKRFQCTQDLTLDLDQAD